VCNKQWAKEKAAQLLQGLRLPQGAQALAREPRGDGGLLRSPQSVSGGDELVDRHRLWRVHLSLAAVEAFVEHNQHVLGTGSSTAGGPSVPPNHSLTFQYVPRRSTAWAYDPRNPFISTSALQVTFVTLPHGWTGIRADAQVVWIYPRTEAQMVPAHTYVIWVRTGSTTRHIREFQPLAGRIIRKFDSLEVVQPGQAYSCPAFRSRRPPITIEFHAFDPRSVAHAIVPGSGFSTPCDPIVFTVDGRATQLVGGDFASWLRGVLKS
jgi:hypothetical protein